MANEPHEDGTAASWLASEKGSPEEWRRAEEEESDSVCVGMIFWLQAQWVPGKPPLAKLIVYIRPEGAVGPTSRGDH